MRILIAGGGIGGLTTALCLVRQRFDVRVMEQADEFSEVGAGIQLSPNAMRVMQALGLEAVLRSVAFKPRSLDLRLGRSGRLLLAIPVAEVAEEVHGAPYLTIHRADLLRVLIDALHERAPGVLRPGNQVTGYENGAAGVTVYFADGTTAECNVLIGADGIRSTVREAMLGPGDPVFTGYVAWRTIISTGTVRPEIIPLSATVWAARKRHVVTYYVRGGELINVVGVVKQDTWQEESWARSGRRADMARAFEGFDATIAELIDAGREFHLWGLFDRQPMKRWTDGQVALLGDAAHPMLPFAAQGGAMAIEDAWVLADRLAKAPGSPEQALKDYQAARAQRTGRVQMQSSRNGTSFHALNDNFVIRWMFWLIRKLAGNRILQAQHWLYGYDVTQS